MINSLPNEIGQLKNLERFVFLANPISTIPSTFSGLSQLRELDCRRCLLGDIAIFSELPYLKKLLCENNAATILDGRFNSLQELNAGHNSITRLLLVGTGQTLVSLNVSYAKISSLGQEFFDALVSCESLNLDSNQIKSFSDSFSQLTNLRNFSMKNNQLTSLPDSIGQLQRLHTLDLANNNLGSLPSTIWNCSQLIVLNVSSNLIQEFPMPQVASSNDPSNPNAEDGKPQLKGMPSLPTLKAPNGNSTTNNRSLPPLAKSLQELFMGDNGLGDNVFGPISLLSELRVLNLSFNDLYEIPSSTLSKCESLEELYLSGNSLTSLPAEDFENLSNLKTFFLNGNKLQTLPAELGKLKHLESLDVSSNLLKYNVTNWPYDWNWFVFVSFSICLI
jgi:adenylate cyclase